MDRSCRRGLLLTTMTMAAVAFLVMGSARAAPLGAWLCPAAAAPATRRILSRRLASSGSSSGGGGGSGAEQPAPPDTTATGTATTATATGTGAATSSSTASTVSPSSRGLPREEALRRPLIICGPSGVGKGTLLGLMLQELGGEFGFSVSHTTRKPRPGEVHGVHYHFTSPEEMRAGIAAGRFLEHASVHGNLYGTSFEAVRAVREAGKVCVLDIDVQGVVSVKQAAAEGRLAAEGVEQPLSVFVAPPSLDALEARLRGRRTESEADLQRRLGNAAREVEYGLAGGNFDMVVVNGQLETAYQDLVGFLEARYYQPPGAAPS